MVDFRTRRDRRVYPKRGAESLEKYLRDLDSTIKAGARRSATFPNTIIFDWNGTVDARGTGVGIPSDVLFALKKLGKTVIIFTSSVAADRKLFMRKWCEQNGVAYTDNPKILKNADMYIGDKNSDERRAGRYGVNFVYTKDFDMSKIVTKHGTQTITHPEHSVCKCGKIVDGKRSCDCVVTHPLEKK